MKFIVENSLFKRFPNAKIGGLFILGLDNSKDSPNISNLLNTYTSGLKGESSRLLHKRILDWEHTLNILNIDTEKNLPSHKALIQRATKSGSIPDISPLVNMYNYASIKHTIPLGGHDLDSIKSISVGLTNGSEIFTPMNSDKQEKIERDEFAYIDREANEILTRHLVWRQSDTDKITNKTTNVFIPIDDVPNIRTSEELEEIAIEIASCIISELGGKAYFGIANRFHTEIDTNTSQAVTVDKNKPKFLLNKRMDIVTDEKLIDEVLDKGVKEIFPTKEELKKILMSGRRIRLYTGIDPTANFIHMGHMIWMKKLREFQKLGHEVIFLIGGFTAMIGDPDKQYTREPLTREKVEANFQNYRKDASKILDFDSEENPIQVLNNYDWLSRLTLEDWLGVMSNVTMQHILSHDMFKNRIAEETPIRLHETMYPLMQGYDSVHMEVDLEVGGSDQTFNMLTGRILERNMIGKEKFVLTMKLLTDNSGKKMGKTTNNAISFKDAPNDVYGKIMSFSDEIVPLAYELLSTKSIEEIKKITDSMATDPMKAKKDLAFELTELIHTTELAGISAKYFEDTIQNKVVPTNIPVLKISGFSSESANILDIIETAKAVESRGETKRLIAQGGIKVNGEKVSSHEEMIKLEKDTIIQIGKRKWLKLI